jgi:hypothetical protein
MDSCRRTVRLEPAPIMPGNMRHLAPQQATETTEIFGEGTE